MEGLLVVVRHGESLWNAKGLWTGWRDIPLSDKGKQEARKAAETIRNIHVDFTYTSTLSRALQTLEIIKDQLGLNAVPTVSSDSLNERDYGDYTGKSKWDIQKQVGEEQFKKIRRGWDVPVPAGETLKDVYNRVVPYYQKDILPLLENGKNVLVAAHGNSIRALMKYIENISEADIANAEIRTGEVLIYHINATGKVTKKERLAVNKDSGKQ